MENPLSITPLPACRVGKVSVGFWLDPDYRRKLKILGASVGRTAEDLASEALNDLFSKYGVGRVGQTAPDQVPDTALSAALRRLADTLAARASKTRR